MGRGWNASLSAEVVDSSLVRPFLRLLRQFFPQRILPYIGQLLLVFNPVAQPVMKRFPLPRSRLVQMLPAELAFPKLHPSIYVEMQIVRRAEEMKMIRHEEVIAHPPRCCFLAPDFGERLLDGRVGHPRDGVLCVDGDEENVGLAGENVRASGGRLASSIAMDSFAGGHAMKVRRRRRFWKWKMPENLRRGMVGTRSTASHSCREGGICLGRCGNRPTGGGRPAMAANNALGLAKHGLPTTHPCEKFHAYLWHTLNYTYRDRSKLAKKRSRRFARR